MKTLTPSFLIGKHLPPNDAPIPVNRCVMCGAENESGFGIDFLTKPFLDADCLRPGDGVCRFCAACLGESQGRGARIICTSFLATPTKLLRLKRDDIWQHLTSPPTEEPFVFGVTYSYKKHIFFRSTVNPPGSRIFTVRTDKATVEVDLDLIQELISIMQRWYTVCKPTAQEPTWLTKSDILNGCQNFKRIEEYGVNKFMKENAIVEPWRKTALLELLTYALNKRKDG